MYEGPGLQRTVHTCTHLGAITYEYEQYLSIANFDNMANLNTQTHEHTDTTQTHRHTDISDIYGSPICVLVSFVLTV